MNGEVEGFSEEGSRDKLQHCSGYSGGSLYLNKQYHHHKHFKSIHYWKEYKWRNVNINLF